ncbi:MAG: response regulator transcription factor [Bacillota bacterium]|nr:response regulator transcription factor [Mollicutes bacterium]
MEQKKILVVDDEEDIVKVIEHRLSKEGYRIITAGDGEEALWLFQRERPDLMILDLMLPKIDGFEVCRLIREKSDVPIIILSARTDELDRLLGFRMGGDDYMTKPFSPSELALRVKAIFRRMSGVESANKTAFDLVKQKGLEINPNNYTVTLADKEVQLTPKEFKLLWLMASQPEYVFSREQLLEQIWDSDSVKDADNVTVMISRLRDKIEENPGNPSYIKTVWGAGYKFSSS